MFVQLASENFRGFSFILKSVTNYRMLQTSGITILQGSTYSGNFHAKDDNEAFYDLHGWTGRAYLRYLYSSGILYNFGSTTFNYPSGIILTILPSGTAALPIQQCIYDIEITSGVNVYRVFGGKADVSPEVTH